MDFAIGGVREPKCLVFGYKNVVGGVELDAEVAVQKRRGDEGCVGAHEGDAAACREVALVEDDDAVVAVFGAAIGKDGAFPSWCDNSCRPSIIVMCDAGNSDGFVVGYIGVGDDVLVAGDNKNGVGSSGQEDSCFVKLGE